MKSCASLVDSELAARPVCPHCNFRPTNDQADMLPAADVPRKLDVELDWLLQDWLQTLPDDLDDPIVQQNLELLKPAARNMIDGFMSSKNLPDPVTPDFAAAVQEVLEGLEKIKVTGNDIKQALLRGSSPATPEAQALRDIGSRSLQRQGHQQAALRGGVRP